MSKALVIHIGTPKTGSSSLQRALLEGRFTVPGVRVAYPDRLSETDLARDLKRGRQRAAAARLQHLGRWLQTTDADVFAVSSEHFVAVPPATFAAALQRDLPGWDERLRTVCYLRPHGPRMSSVYAQQRKAGVFLGSYDEFLRRAERSGHFRAADLMERWRRVYDDRLVVRLLSRGTLVGGDVVADFLHLATTGAPASVDALRLNPSLSAEALALLGLVHRSLRDADVPPRVAQRIGKRIAADLAQAGVAENGHRLSLSRAQATEVARIFADDAARLDAAYFPETRPFTGDLRAQVEGAPPESPSVRARDYVDAETRARLRHAATALGTVCAEHGDGWVAQFRAAKGYRSAAGQGDAAARVDAALAPVVTTLTAALTDLR